MYELILLFILVVALVYHEIEEYEHKNKDLECRIHHWSQSMNTDEMVCMNCGKIIKS